MTSKDIPERIILIVGAGCFGLSTALALTARKSFNASKIILLDTSHLATRTAASFDLNRIVRSDYSNPLYAAFAAEAQDLWRNSDWGAENRYSEAGLLMLSEGRSEYLEQALELASNSARICNDNAAVLKLESDAEITEACKTGGMSGTWGYLNRRAGWADAEGAMQYARGLVDATARVTMVTGKVTQLLLSMDKTRVEGVVLDDGSTLKADLTVVATGAWTPTLLDLRSRVAASADVLAYVNLRPDESIRLQNMPSIINLSKGWFIMPPRGGVLKVARHGQGISNKTRYHHPQAGDIEISIPYSESPEKEKEILDEGVKSCREALKELIPWLAEREFDRKRLCWYTDTPTADFIIDYHPDMKGLFIATGGSGHAFKFLPVLGERIVDAIEGTIDDEYRSRWSWKKIAALNEEGEDLHGSAYQSRGGS
jgi:sarcosine oxidase/L-pipecolate oxidase